MTTPDHDPQAPDDETRDRSAEQRDIVAPTPHDVREKARDEDQEGSQPPRRSGA
ncbi:hypothetical protein [Streptacidiphilus melanogenes]|uniref:hypothetical protein n=1 Tax=Streptacidiphilus melanogenes TaxID=411235 RepID=UPI0013648C15|nr:hypothetical protein [Streptacidiphilus melanogenes]